MISNRNIINLILEIKKQVLQPYHCLIDSLFLIERFYNVKKTNSFYNVKKTNGFYNVKKTNGFFDQKNQKNRTKKTDQPCFRVIGKPFSHTYLHSATLTKYIIGYIWKFSVCM